MPKRHLAAAAGALAAGIYASVLANPAIGASLTLHVNTGLWEITSTSAMSGAPPISPAMMASIPPERRAHVLAMMHESMARALKPRTVQSCVTQKDLDRPFRPMINNAETKCSETVVSASTTMEDIRISCTGKHPMDGHFQFQSPTPGTMNGKMTMNMGEGGQVSHINADISGRWLGASCGSVAPRGD
jgi:hypothetical protein